MQSAIGAVQTLVVIVALLVMSSSFVAADPVRVLIVGDSTVRDYPIDDTRRGWGQLLPELYDSNDVTFFNRAVGGRSSKTFITEGLWQNALTVNPDYVLIQFGHNDLTGLNLPGQTFPDPVPDPLPSSGFGSSPLDWFRNNIRTYIADARAIGAIPVVISPMERRLFDGNGELRQLNQLWAQAAHAVAEEEHVASIDLNTFSVDLFTDLGLAGSEFLQAVLPGGIIDNVHHSEAGARIFAEFIADHLTFIVGDLDVDGFVGITDLNLVLGSWNQNVTAASLQGDPTGDGFVGIEDLNLVLGNWNTGTPPGVLSGLSATVPEPAAGVVLLCLSAPLIGARRRVS